MELSPPEWEPEPIQCAPSECEPLELALVEGQAESRLWRQHVERYHYLGWRVPFGANLRYFVRNRERELACLLWTSPAWKMQARDAWIGWSDQQRQRNLQSIVNNGRFLILPWVRVKGLASKILALSARHMPHDWQTRYGHRPLLLETLVDAYEGPPEPSMIFPPEMTRSYFGDCARSQGSRSRLSVRRIAPILARPT